MSGKIRFERHMQKSTLHNPMMGFELDTQDLEIRKDPLTGRQSVFNPRLEDKGIAFFGKTDTDLIHRLAKQSEEKCFLCGDRWRKTTPTYPDAIVPGGRVQVGDSVLFPNLFPISRVHAVIRVGSRHYVPLNEFSPSVVEEAFQASTRFINAFFDSDGGTRFFAINGNYLGPAGASIPHPHFQVVGSDIPFSHLEELLRLSRKYREENGTCYWTDLVEKERELGVRFIAQMGSVSWITSYSPQGTNETLGIFTEKRDFLEMKEKDLVDLAAGFSAVLAGYSALGLSTFNFTVYSGPLGESDEAFRCFFRIISRQNVYENYRTDDYFLQKLLRNELILNTPESLATILRKEFER